MTTGGGYAGQPAGERLAGAAGAALVVGLLGAGLLWGLAGSRTMLPEEVTTLLALRPPPPPPLRRPPAERAHTRAASGKASPRNLRNKATPVAAPPPVVRLPLPPPPVVAAPSPAGGMAARSGASDRPGPGEGAGGSGAGTGSGGNGEGEGAGAGYTPPDQINDLRYQDLPAALRARAAQGTAEILFHVDERGRVTGCRVTRTSGDRELDDATCWVVQRRLRFRPSRDPQGRPVGANIVNSEGWIRDRDPDGEGGRGPD